jgi:hypothetical protein
MIDRREANLKMLNEAAEVQNKTKDAIWRIQRQAEEAEGLGTQTLEELRRQGQQMVRSISVTFSVYVMSSLPLFSRMILTLN